MLNQEEYEMYQKAVNFILRNLENTDFNQILRQNGYKIIPCKLSYVIENLEKAGYTITKQEPNIITPSLNQNFDKEEFLSFVKNKSLSLFALIKDTELELKDNSMIITFNKNAFFKYKQCIENNNKDLLKQYSYEYLNQSYNINICIKNE